MNIELITGITGAIQRYINEKAGLSPKIQLEFITRQTYPSALIKSGAVNTVRKYIQGGGVYSLTFYLSYRGQSFGDKEAAFKWLGAVGLFLEEASKPRLFRKEGFKEIGEISGLEIGEGIRVKGAEQEQAPIDVYGQDKDGVATYQSVFSLKFVKGALPQVPMAQLSKTEGVETQVSMGQVPMVQGDIVH